MIDPWNVLAALLITGLAAASGAEARRGSPAPLFALYWSVLTWAALLIAPDVAVWPPALFFIALGVAAFGVGGRLARAFPGRPRPRAPARLPDERVAAWSVALGSACGLAGVTVLVMQSGLGFSPGALPAIARQYSIERYWEFRTEPLAYRLLVIPHYAACLLAGHLFLTTRSRRILWLAFLPLVPTVLITLVLTTKASTIFAGILWIAGYAATAVYERGRGRADLRSGLLARGSALAALAVPTILVVSQMWRGERTETSELVEVLSDFRLDIFGFLGVFSSSFRAYWFTDWLTPSLGAYTFPGLVALAGGPAREMGVFADPVLIANGHPSNIFTAFRCLVEDFTPAGAIALLLAAGFAAQRCFQRARAGSPGAVAGLAAVYATILWSHVVFFFGYNSVIAGWMLFAAVLAFAARRPATAVAG